MIPAALMNLHGFFSSLYPIIHRVKTSSQLHSRSHQYNISLASPRNAMLECNVACLNIKWVIVRMSLKYPNTKTMNFKFSTSNRLLHDSRATLSWLNGTSKFSNFRSVGITSLFILHAPEDDWSEFFLLRRLP